MPSTLRLGMQLYINLQTMAVPTELTGSFAEVSKKQPHSQKLVETKDFYEEFR